MASAVIAQSQMLACDPARYYHCCAQFNDTDLLEVGCRVSWENQQDTALPSIPFDNALMLPALHAASQIDKTEAIGECSGWSAQAVYLELDAYSTFGVKCSMQSLIIGLAFGIDQSADATSCASKIGLQCRENYDQHPPQIYNGGFAKVCYVYVHIPVLRPSAAG